MGFNKPRDEVEKSKRVQAELDFKQKRAFFGNAYAPDDVLKTIKARRDERRDNQSYNLITDEKRKKELASLSYFAYRNIVNDSDYNVKISEESVMKEIRLSTEKPLERNEVAFVVGVMRRDGYIKPCGYNPSETTRMYIINRNR